MAPTSPIQVCPSYKRSPCQSRRNLRRNKSLTKYNLHHLFCGRPFFGGWKGECVTQRECIYQQFCVREITRVSADDRVRELVGWAANGIPEYSFRREWISFFIHSECFFWNIHSSRRVVTGVALRWRGELLDLFPSLLLTDGCDGEVCNLRPKVIVT